MEKFKEFIKKICTKEVIFYGIFGVLTTIINLAISYVLEGYCHIDGSIASAAGIVVAVIFAYFTNRKLVFNSTATTFQENLREFGKFILGRVGTMALEQGSVVLFYNVFDFPFMPVKFTLTIVVIILNFFISKFFAFKK